MTRVAIALAFVAVPWLAVAAPVPKDDDAARLARIYGTKSDPDKDSTFDLSKDVLRIATPRRKPAPFVGVPRGPEFPDLALGTAARVWRDVEGDFTVTVRVAFALTFAKTKAESGLRVAGLVIWSADTDYITAARTEWVNGTAREMFCLFHRIGEGDTAESDNQDPVANSGFLRLERRGERITGSYSRDGKDWTAFLQKRKFNATGPLKVGVFAKHATEAPFEATFDQYTLTVAKK
jgi:regulation of enolase protein 1 (concanavalin A-like superfamily)